MLTFGLSLLFWSFSATAAPINPQIQYLWKTLNGTNLNSEWETAQKLNDVFVQKGPLAAAQLALESDESSFSTGVVRQMVTPLAGREFNPGEMPGDFVLTWMVAAVNDTSIPDIFLKDQRFTTLKSSDVSETITSVNQFLLQVVSDKDLQKAVATKSVFPLEQTYIMNPEYRMGVVTSLQYGQSIFMGGTNRRPIKKMTEDFLCQPIEGIMNFQISDKWVGRDIPRNPGNDPQVYLNKCMGCHTGLDSLRGAFAGYDFSNNKLTWSPKAKPKMNNNPHVFDEGYYVKDHAWEHLGWWNIAPQNIGQKYVGAKPFVEMVVESSQFYQCLVKRAKDTLCPHKKPSETLLSQIAYKVESTKTLRSLFARVAVDVCLNQ